MKTFLEETSIKRETQGKLQEIREGAGQHCGVCTCLAVSSVRLSRARRLVCHTQSGDAQEAGVHCRPAAPWVTRSPFCRRCPAGTPRRDLSRRTCVLEGKSCSPNFTDYPVPQDQDLPSGHPDKLNPMTGSASAPGP